MTLKNCPFCNYDSISRFTDARGYFVLQCGRCGAQMANYDHLPVKEWNTRAGEAEQIREMPEVKA